MKEIRNSKGAVVAYEHEGPNRTELRNRSAGLIAWYDKNTKQTFSKNGKMEGFGDQRGKFIPNDD